MSKRYLAKVIPLILLASTAVLLTAAPDSAEKNTPPPLAVITGGVILLPQPSVQGQISLEEALLKRRSRRSFTDDPLILAQFSQLLWAAQGQTAPGGYRTAPSAGALYPIELYALVGRVDGLDPGIYHYQVEHHGLKLIKKGDLRADLQRACLRQASIGQAPVSLVIAGDYARTAKKYHSRAQRYVHMEAGHISQNIYLQAESLGLGTCAMGAFDDKNVKALFGIREEPLSVMPVGLPKNEKSSP